MNPLTLAVAVPVAFLAGVVAHKYVLSEAQAIKLHVSQAEARIRADFQALLNKAAGKL